MEHPHLKRDGTILFCFLLLILWIFFSYFIKELIASLAIAALLNSVLVIILWGISEVFGFIIGPEKSYTVLTFRQAAVIGCVILLIAFGACFVFLGML